MIPIQISWKFTPKIERFGNLLVLNDYWHLQLHLTRDHIYIKFGLKRAQFIPEIIESKIFRFYLKLRHSFWLKTVFSGWLHVMSLRG